MHNMSLQDWEVLENTWRELCETCSHEIPHETEEGQADLRAPMAAAARQHIHAICAFHDCQSAGRCIDDEVRQST